MSKYTDIGVEKHGNVGLIEIRKPPLNFFDVALINQIADALEEFDNDIEIRAWLRSLPHSQIAKIKTVITMFPMRS